MVFRFHSSSRSPPPRSGSTQASPKYIPPPPQLSPPPPPPPPPSPAGQNMDRIEVQIVGEIIEVDKEIFALYRKEK